MWIKLFLLTLYLLLLFFLSRLLEAASWYHGKNTFLSSSTLVDPFALSVKKLKQLLDNRGVSYSGAIEKQELVSLVEASGDPVEEELSEASEDDDGSNTLSKYQSTQFTCGSHFYEEVEDTKDSVWLVQVVSSNSYQPLLDDETWKKVVIKVASFGVRTGVFKCSLDERLCARKGWISSRLIMALPRSNKAKEDVVMYDYLRLANKAPAVLQWVRSKLSSRVQVASSLQDLNNHWITPDSAAQESTIKVILFSKLKEPPLFLSSLAIKFTGRVKFGMVNALSKKDYYKTYLNDSKLPVYLAVMPERTFHYGKNMGECFNFKCMELFLKSFRPEMNDVFLWSLLLVNALAGLQLFLISGQFWKHFVIYVMCFVKYNCILFLFWLLVLTLYQFPFMTTFTNMCLKCLRMVSGTHLAAMCRNDWKNFYSYPFLFITFIFFGTVIGIALRKWGSVFIEEESSLFSNWWSVPWDSYVMTYFFRPMATLTRPVASQDFDLEEGIELLIERLAVPNLWLQPVISSDYIKDLPIWKYQGWCEADDAMEENKLDFLSSSEDESTNISENSDSTLNSFASELPEHQQNRYFQIRECCQNEGVSCAAVKSSQETVQLSSHAKEPNKIVYSKCSCSAAASDFHIPLTGSLNSSECKCTKKCSESVLSSIKSSSPDSNKDHDGPETLRAPQGMLEFRECSICLENYRYGELLCGLPCGHNYHMNCIMLWLFRDNHCCPVCRWPSYKMKNSATHLHLQ